MGLGWFGNSNEDIARRKAVEDAAKAEAIRGIVAERFQLDPGDGQVYADAVAGVFNNPNFGLEQNVTDANATDANVTVPEPSREDRLMGIANDLAKRNQQFSRGASGMAEAAKDMLYK